MVGKNAEQQVNDQLKLIPTKRFNYCKRTSKRANSKTKRLCEEVVLPRLNGKSGTGSQLLAKRQPRQPKKNCPAAFPPSPDGVSILEAGAQLSEREGSTYSRCSSSERERSSSRSSSPSKLSATRASNKRARKPATSKEQDNSQKSASPSTVLLSEDLTSTSNLIISNANRHIRDETEVLLNHCPTPTSLDLPQTITFEAHNAMVTDPTLLHLSKRAKDTINELLQNIECIYQKALQVMPLKDPDVRLTKPMVQTTDAKLDKVIEKLEEIGMKVKSLEVSGGKDHKDSDSAPFSYADALKKPKSTLVLRQMGESTNQSELLQKLKQLQCPEDVKITKFKVLQNRIELSCDTESDKSKLQTYLSEQLKEAKVEDKRPALWKLMALNVPDSVSEVQLQMAFTPSKEELGNFRVCATYKSRLEGRSHKVMLVPRKLSVEALNAGFVVAGFHRLRVKKYVPFHRCKNCQQLNIHHTSNCDTKSYCVRCGGRHQSDNCTEEASCINCGSYNLRLHEDKAIPPEEKRYFNVAHAADSACCPVYRAVINQTLDASV